MNAIFARYPAPFPDHRPFGLLLLLVAVGAFLLTCFLLERWLDHAVGVHDGARRQRPATLHELHAGADAPLSPLRRLAALGWLTRLLGNGDLSSTRFVFLGAFGVASLLLVLVFASLSVRYVRTGAADPSLCVLAATSLGTFLGFAANAQNVKTKTASPDPPSTS